jgi:hypothetical protein
MMKGRTVFGLTSGSVEGLFLLFFCSTSLSLSLDDETGVCRLLNFHSAPANIPSVLDFLFFDLRFFSTPRGPFCAAILLFFLVMEKVHE